MHIVMTVNAAWNVVNFRQPLVSALLDEGHEVTVLAPADGSEQDILDMGCDFVPLDMDRKGMNPLSDARLVQTFYRQFRALDPDIVLGFTIKNNIFGSLAAKRLAIPFIPNVTGLGTAFLGGRHLAALAAWLHRIAFRTLPVVFFQNRDDQALFEDRAIVGPEQAQLIPGSGIDLQKFAAADYPDGDGPIRFLMIARLLRDKGVLEFVDAARMVLAEGLDAEFVMLGATESENRTAIARSQLESWLAEGIVSHLGSTDDVRPEIAAAHCIVLPSYREGAPRTLIEGAAMARPSIATRVPGCTAVVEDGITGILCESRSAESLADAFRRFEQLNNREREEMGLAARRKMDREFSVSRVIASYRAAIARLTGECPVDR